MKHLQIPILFVLSFLLYSEISAQNTFNQIINRSDGDIGLSIQQSSSGGYVIGGRTDILGESGYMLAVTEETGDTIFTKGYPGYCPWDDIFLYSVQTNDGGYALGPSFYDNGTEKMCLIKTDEQGIEQWNQQYSNSMGVDFIETSEGGFLIGGASLGNAYLLKTDSEGNQEWAKTISETGAAYISSVIENDDGYIAAGYCDLSSSWKFFIAKINADQSLAWYKIYPGASSEGFPLSVCSSSDGGYLISSAKYYSSSQTYGPYILKTDNVGDTLWTKPYQEPTFSFLFSSAETTTGTFVSVGYSENNEGNEQIYIVETSADGDFIRKQIILTPGSTLCAATDVIPSSDGGVIITGYREDEFGNYDAVLIKSDENGLISSVSDPQEQYTAKIYPNPANQEINIDSPCSEENISITLYDIMGKQVLFSPGNSEGTMKLNVSNLDTGSYILKIESGTYSEIRKIIIQ